MKKIRTKIMAVLLTAAVAAGCIPTAQTVKAETQPAELVPTNYGVADARVQAQQLVVSEGSEVIETKIPELLAVKEKWGAKVKVHLVGRQGIVHTFEVDADNPWLSEFETERIIETDWDTSYVRGNFDKISSVDVDADEREISTGRRHWVYQYFEDSLIAVLNPDTGHWDLLNLTAGEYYEYGFDAIFSQRSVGNQLLIYKQGDTYGFLDKHGERMTEAFCKGRASIYEIAPGVFRVIDVEKNSRLVSVNGCFKGEDIYPGNWGDERIAKDGAVLWTDNEDGSETSWYLNFKTGEKRELDSKCSRIEKVFADETVFAWEYRMAEDEKSGKYGEKSYLETPAGTIDLNSRLGGDFCTIYELSEQELMDISNMKQFQNDYIYAEAYSYVKNEKNQWITQYEYQGLVDADGNKVYGYALPEEWDTKIMTAADGYAVILTNGFYKEYIEGDETSGRTYYDLELIDLSGKIYYKQSDISWKPPTINNYYSSERYISFYIPETGKTLLFDKTKRLCETYDVEQIVLYDSWAAGDNQYAMWVPSGSPSGLYNLDKGTKFLFEEGKNIYTSETDLQVEQTDSGKIFCMMRWEEQDMDYPEYIFNESLDLVMVIPDGSDVIEFSENTVITYGGIYNYQGECIQEGSMMYCDVKDHLLFPIFLSRKEGYTFCDRDGNLMDLPYVCSTVSDFVGGTSYIAYGGKNTYYDSYGPLASVIDSNGEELLKGTFYNRYKEGEYTGDAMAGQGIFMKTIIDGKETWIFYDFEKIEPELDDTVEKEEKEKEKYESLLANAKSLSDFSLGRMKTKFNLPESVPGIGGGEVSLDFSVCPVAVEKSGNTFRVGIGLDMKGDSLFSLKKEKWNSIKRWIEEKKEDELKKLISLDQGSEGVNVAKQKVKASIYGYAEGIVENDEVKNVHGKIVVKMEYSVSQKWQEIVVSIPVVLTATVKADIKAEEAVFIDFSKAEVTGKGSISFTLPEVKLTAGVGVVDVADVSVYGAIRNILVFDNSVHSDELHVQDYVEGDMGVSATVLFASYEKVLWPGKKQVVYDSTGGLITSGVRASVEKMGGSEEDYRIDRSYAKDISSWGDETVSAGNANAIHILQKNVFQQAEPKIIKTDDGLKMMVYVSDVPERATGSHTAVYYSIYDGAQDKWQGPVMVDDDGTADFYPSITTDGNDIYVAWTNAKTNSFTENASISEVAAQCEISVAKYNREKNAFDVADTLTDNDLADVRPSVFAQGGNVYVAWLQNTDNDILELSGTNNIYVSVYENGILNEEPVLCQSHNIPVYSVKGGIVSGRPVLAYVVDQDGNLNTSQDSRLHAGFLDEDFSDVFLPEQSEIGNISFTRVGGEDVLLYSCSNGLMSSANLKAERCLLTPEEVTGTEYQVISGEGKDLLLGTEASEEGTNLLAYVLQNNEISGKVNLTCQRDTLHSPNGFFEDGVFHLAFSKTNFAISEENLEQNTDICWMKLEEYSDLATENLNLDQDAITPGEQTTLTVDVKNLGTQAVQNYEVQVFADGNQIGMASSSVPLAAGGQRTEEVEILIPENCKPGTTLSCHVVGEGTESYLENNDVSVSLGYTDLETEIFGDAKNSKKPVSVYVTNHSSFGTDAKVNIYDTDENGELLKSYSVKDLKAGMCKEFSISAEELAKFNKDVLYVTAEASVREKNLADNYNFLYVKDLLKGSSTNNPNVSKKDQIISGTSSYTKVVGSKPFSLNVKLKTGDGTLTYVSSKPSVASVSNNGKVTIKKVGKTIITVTAKETAKYRSKVFKVTLNVTAPKKGTILTDPKTKAKYKVVKKGKTLEYNKPLNKKVKKATIPATVTMGGVKYSVTGISAKAFAGCSKLKSITIKTGKLTSKTVGAKAFKGIHAKAVIKVPKKQKKSYEKWIKKKGIGKKVKIKAM